MKSVEELAEKSLPAVNELLRSCTPIGAYCLGAFCCLAWSEGIEAPPALLDLAAKCPSVQQAVELYAEFKALRDGARAQ